MARAATAQLKCNPPLGAKPELRWLRPDEIGVDYAYQRSMEAGASQTLIRRIAVHWDWSLCQPLAIAKRSNGALMIVDGQHRQAAAKLRGDIDLLPCIISDFGTYEGEAAAFVALNQQRRPLGGLEIFKAALAGGDMEAGQISVALKDAGLRLATSTNLKCVAPGSMSNVRGLQRCYRVFGLPVLVPTLQVIAKAFDGEVLQYGGSIFPGVEAIVAGEVALDPDFAGGPRFARMALFVGATTQKDWYKDISAKTGEFPTRTLAAAALFRERWSPVRDGKTVEAVEFLEAHECGGCAPPVYTEPKPKLSFEEQVARVERGEVGIGPAFKQPSKPIDGTLGGIGTAMF